MAEETPKKAGRPFKEAEERHSTQLAVRLSPKEVERLDAYCKAKGWTRAQAVRYWLEMITL
ncbi:hypothetical protein [uncultured Dialister sp.]|uniref:hypothetical protein n=1 Tax=uncultured Dialister sp. TaxID=278064 RepID=UPI00265D5972|nr:hypothetical protein [uncultured Dialister sp.]